MAYKNRYIIVISQDVNISLKLKIGSIINCNECYLQYYNLIDLNNLYIIHKLIFLFP